MLFGKYINKYYLKYALLFIIGIAALIFVDIEQVKIPEYVANVVDILGSPDPDRAEIGRMVLLTIHVTGEMFIGRIVWRYALFFASKKIESDLRHDMFLKAEQLPIEYYHENKVGTIMAWFTNDLETIEEFLGWGTVMMVDAIFLTIVVITKMVLLNWQLAILVSLPLALIVIWAGLVERFMVTKWELRQQYNDELYDFSQETFTGIRVIKAFVKENQQIRAFSKIARKNADFNVKFSKLNTFFDVIIEVIIRLVFALILGIGGWIAWAQISGNPINLFGSTLEITVKEIVTFAGYFTTLIWPLIAMGQVVTMHTRSKGSLKRISAFLSTEVTVKNPDNPIILKDIKGKIEFKGFSFTYPDSKVDKKYLDNVSLTINPGETIGVIGRIGSGKTTLANSLLRLYNVNKGQILIDDNDIMDCDIDSVRESVAYVPQDNFLFSDMIENNIAFSSEVVDENKVKEAASFAVIHDDIAGFKEQYKTVSGERGVTLSGGQKQRISIARAYLKDSPIMILDDSVSAVDIKTEETILKNIKTLRKDKTTIVIASRVSTVNSLDKIIVLNEGKLEAFDTPANLAKTSKTYQKMVFLQQLEKEVEGGE